MNKGGIDTIVPRIIILLTFIVSSLRIFSVISPLQTMYAIVIIILLIIILSMLLKKINSKM